jgi:hypothetical protein
MDAARLRRRILVIVVTTRAAASSLRPGDGQVQLAVRRGIQLLDGMATDVAEVDDPEASEQLEQARRDLVSLLDESASSQTV